MPSHDVTVHDNTDESRYEAAVAGEATGKAAGDVAGFAAYRLQGDTLTFTHTEVQPAFEGQGVGSALARHALDDARRRGLKVVPACVFIAAYIERHPDDADLLAPGAAH